MRVIRTAILQSQYAAAKSVNGKQLMLYFGIDQYVDLLFFNRKLNCLVAVELKTGKFKTSYLGELQGKGELYNLPFNMNTVHPFLKFKDVLYSLNSYSKFPQS